MTMATDDRLQDWADKGLDAFDSMSLWLPWTTKSVTSTYTIGPKERVILANATGGAFTVTLPNATLRRNQTPITVKRLNGGGNAVTVGSAGGTIDGAATQSLGTQYATIQVVSDGQNWHIV